MVAPTKKKAAKKKPGKHAGGRPTKMTPETLKKLEDAYLSDATHLEACIYAGISEPTLHQFRKDNQEFSKHIDALRGMTGLQAKVNVRRAIKEEDEEGKGVSRSQWYLERRDPEFKHKSEVKNEVHLDSATALIEAIKDRKAKRGIK